MERIIQLRRAAGAAIADGFFRGVASSSALVPASWPSVHGVERVRNIRYHGSSDPAHLLDVYLPPRRFRDEPRPVCVYYHGGGFRILSKDTHWLMGLVFARAGYVVFNIDYRKKPHRYPAAHEDAFRAYQWAIEHAGAFGGDPDRIFVAGESAGANLAASVVVATCWRRPEPWAAPLFDAPVPLAAVPFCGMLQVSDPLRFSRRRRLPIWLRDRVEEVAESYLGTIGPQGCGHDLADPVVFYERGIPPQRPLPPFFLSVGTKDPVLDDTRRLDIALQRLRADVDARYYPGEVHAFQAFLWRQNARTCWTDTFSFLDRVLESRSR